MLTFILAILLFLLLIFPHELGHFLVAKAVGVQVNEFAFGMGPAIFRKQGKETLYSIRLFPVGGYCAMEGENDESDSSKAFNNKPALSKIAVLIAGSGMNVLIAVIVLSVVFGIVGQPTVTLDKLEKGMPGIESGLEKGDKILEINGKKISKWEDVSANIPDSKGSIEMKVSRNGSEKNFNISPVKVKGRYVIGITPTFDHNPKYALVNGGKGTLKMSVSILEAFKQLVTGKAKAKDLSGPIGMVSMVHQSEEGGIMNYFLLLALISLNLAIFNMLPFPALDGGRIIFVIIRSITGKMITDKQEAFVHLVGMVLLITLMIFATWNDIIRLFFK